MLIIYSNFVFSVLQNIPKFKNKRSKFLKTSQFLVDTEELKKLDIRNEVKKTGWSVSELAQFGFLHVQTKTNDHLFAEICQKYFPRKDLSEILELYFIVRKPFNIKL